MVKFILVVAIAVCMVFCSPKVSASEPKLAIADQLPYHASVCKSSTLGTIRQHLCSGAIVNERWILTAAHCIVDYAKTLQVHVGSTQKYENGQTYKVAEVVYHDDFGISNPDTIKSNLAMLKTAEPIQLGKSIRGIAMEHKQIGDGVLATISGWKTTGEDSKSLRFAQLNTVSTETCIERYENNKTLVDSETLCGKYISATPIDDFGCLLVANGRLIGVSLPNDRLGRPKRFTRMSLFANWVEKVAKRL